MFGGRRHKADTTLAAAALLDAQINLAATKKQTPEVKEVARSLRLVREENHFIERVSRALGGDK